MRRFTTIAFATALAGAMLIGGQCRATDMVTDTQALKWQPAPPFLPKGAEMVVLSGDPAKAGPYVLRLKMPSGYVIPAHHHPTTENVTILSGTFHAGMGDKVDKANAAAFKPGGFASLPANMNHFAWAATETVVQVNGDGPFAITYVNSADDPRKAQ